MRILSHRFTVGILSHGFARLGYTSKVEHNLRRVEWGFCPTDLHYQFCHTGLRDWDTHQKWSTTYRSKLHSQVSILSHRFTVGILSHGFARLGYTSKVEHNLRRVEWGFCPTDLHYQFCHTGLRDWDTHQKWSTTYRSKLHSQVSILSHRFTVGILSHGFARLGYTSKVEHNLRRVEWGFCPTDLQLGFCHTGLRDWDTHQKWSTTYGESSEDFVPQIYTINFVTRVCATGIHIKSGAQLTEASCIVKWVFCPTDLQLGFCHTGLRDWDTHQKWSTTYGESSEDFVPQIYSWDFVTRVCATGIHIKSGAQLTESRVRILSHRFTLSILSHGFARLGYTSKVEHNLQKQAA